jgi:hypothetical protein
MTCGYCAGLGYTQEGAIATDCTKCATSDAINPLHYRKGDKEVFDYIIDVTRDLPGDEAVMIGNIIKYVSRYRDKHPDPRTDIDKAKWYLNKLRNLLIAKEPQGES